MEHLQQKLDTIFPGSSRFALLEARAEQLGQFAQWHRLRYQRSSDTGHEGISLNILSFSPDQLLPLPIRFHKNGRERLMQDADLQRAIANAFWQTCWAEGALRTARGETFPVAFAVTDRLGPVALAEQHITSIEARNNGWLVGTEEIIVQRLQEKTRAGRLSLHDGQLSGDLDPEEQAFLQKYTFVDRFIGDNSRAQTGTRPLRQLVRVNASHLISRLYAGELGHFAPEGFRASLLAATNNGFFLNFPEEYRNPLTAMNDPVGLLVVDGELLQAPLVPRAAFLAGGAGKASITTVSMQHCVLQLPWERAPLEAGGTDGFAIDNEGAHGRQTVVFTPAWRAELGAGEQKTPAGEVVEVAIVFRRIVAVAGGGGMEIPASGFVLSMPARRISARAILAAIREHGAGIGIRLRAELFGMQHINTAIGAGPALLQNGQIIAQDFFTAGAGGEVFLPVRSDGEITQAGVAPTRFPHDSGRTRAPRTILGLKPDGSALLCVIDGRLHEHSLGATLREAGAIGKALGCSDVLNMDGGGSSVLQLWPESLRQTVLLPEISPGIANIPSDNGHRDRLMPVVISITEPAGERSTTA